MPEKPPPVDIQLGNNETENPRPAVDDPAELLKGFRSSDVYQAAYEDFYRDKTPTASEEKKHTTFENFEPAKQAMVQYAKYNIVFTI